MDEEIIKYFAASIVNGLEHIQRKGIIHRDIKPCNILLDDEFTLKITDFGTAKLLNCTDEKVQKALHKRNKREEARSVSPMKKHSFVGTNQYISPEVLKGLEPTPAIDLWSLGVILYQMYVGKTPFMGDNEMITYQNICEGEGLDIQPKLIPDDAWKFIKSILKIDPTKRLGYCLENNTINYETIKNYSYFKGIDFNDLIYDKVIKLREDSVSLGDCSIGQTEQDVEKFDENDKIHGNRSSAFKSISIPCPTEEDDDFYTDNFTQNPCKEEDVEKDNDQIEIKTRPSSEKNLIDYVQDDYFSEVNRKYSLKCDYEKLNNVP